MYGIQPYIDKLLDESTPSCPLWNIESIRVGKSPVWNYIDGCMMSALYQLYIITGEKRYFNFVKNYIDYYVEQDGTIRTYNKEKFNLDDVNEGRVLFDLYGARATSGTRKFTPTKFGLTAFIWLNHFIVGTKLRLVAVIIQTC